MFLSAGMACHCKCTSSSTQLYHYQLLHLSTSHQYLASCCISVVQTLLLQNFSPGVWIFKKSRCIRQDPPPHSLSFSTCHQRHWPQVSQRCIHPSGTKGQEGKPSDTHIIKIEISKHTNTANTNS